MEGTNTTSAEKGKVTLSQILAQGDDKTQVARAIRVTKSANIAYKSIIDTRTLAIFKLEDELEAMSDLSVSNSMLTRNAIESASSFDSTKYVARRCELLVEISVAKAELEVIEADESFYE
jgi:hypothetical protein